MDYTGLGRFVQFKVNRPLAASERADQLRLDRQASETPQDWLSVVKINSTYLELVDRWYPVKGWWTWMGTLIAFPALALVIALTTVAIGRNELGGWVLFAAFVPVFGAFIWLGALMVQTESFRHTHYPIRLNRRTRQVFFFRTDGTVGQIAWDRLFLCAVKTELTMWQSSEDVRAHVLGEDKETVTETFTLAYPDLGGRRELMQLWEYIRRYMETEGGVEACHREVGLCLPVDGRREGLAFGVVRVFAMAANRPFLQLIASPIASLTVLGRWFAMVTSRVPRWPAYVEDLCRVDAADPYKKDWRDNGKYDFYELGWPVICFVVGLTVVMAGVIWLVASII